MLNLKLRIMFRAIKVRLENGEDLNVILASYPKLSDQEKNILVEALNEEARL